MATIGNTALTLADWAKRTDEGGKMATIVDLLSQTNQMMDDMLWVEGNQTSGTKTTVRTGLPTGTWRLLYQGVQPTKSTTAQVIENCGNLEAYSQVDKDLADLNGNTAEFRLGEDSAFFEGLTQQMQGALLYSNQLTTPAQIMGLAPRYASLSAGTAANIIDAGGTGSTNTSIWLVGWGPQTIAGIFPKAKIGGLMHEDLGRDTLVQSDGTLLEVYRSHFKWEAGLMVRDWRFVVRICNIDVTLLGGEPDQRARVGLPSRADRSVRCVDQRRPDAPERCRRRLRPLGHLLQPRRRERPGSSGAQQDERPVADGAVGRQARHDVPWHPDPDRGSASLDGGADHLSGRTAALPSAPKHRNHDNDP